jgi:toxin ParE1/3/4
MLRIHPEARREFQRSVAYYRTISILLAKRFVVDVEESFLRVMEAPERYPFQTDDARAKLLKDFPFAIIYTHEEGKVFIIAVMHQKRKPGYWLNRIQ